MPERVAAQRACALRRSGYDLSDWTDKKYTLGLEFPNLPFWIEGNLRITQSQAILLHVAKKARLMGATDEARAQALMLLGCSADLRDALVTLSYGGTFDADRDAFVTGPLARMVKCLEAFAAKHASSGPFLLGGACCNRSRAALADAAR